MSLYEAQTLRVGDSVRWTSPTSERIYLDMTITHIDVFGPVVRIMGRDGESVECYHEELSKGSAAMR